MNFQPILDLVDTCVQHGIEHAIISPGSRNGPLTLAFARHRDITTYVVPDERSAAYMAIGMAQEIKLPIAIICTSGTAVLNYAPAIAEAFFQQVPLLVLTADRPPELVGQQDGQTIFQPEVYGKHVKKSLHVGPEYPESSRESIYHDMNEAMETCIAFPSGPVHINFAFREPFYPTENNMQHSALDVLASKPHASKEPEWKKFKEIWKQCTNILILGRQNDPSESLLSQLHNMHSQVVVAGDIISNLHKLDRTITQLDTIPDNLDLQPELLITFGNSGISKRLKLFLRKNKPAHHWHIQPEGDAADTYQSITEVVYTKPEIFLTEANKWKTPKDSSYSVLWKEVQHRGKQLVNDSILFSPQGEIALLDKVIEALPDNTNLHLANSLSVRLANYIGLSNKRTTSFSNRGTSGIDGSTSTAIGMAMVTVDPVVLITGDMAFFYDRNAFWHNQLPANFYVVILNNHAGGIFGVIDGPARQPELEEYFETNQKLTAENLSKDYHLPYTFVTEKGDFPDLKDFFSSTDRPKILEIETNLKANKKAFTHLQNEIKIDGVTLRLETNKGI